MQKQILWTVVAVRRLVSDRRGGTAIIVALLAPLLIGAIAVAVDVSYWRSRTMFLQTVADAAAISAVTDLATGTTGTAATARIVGNASTEARRMCSDCAVTVTYPYLSDSERVRVQVQDTRAARFFSGFYDVSQRTLQASAVARRGTSSGTETAAGSACILTLATTGDGVYLQSNTGRIGPTDCEVVSNSTSASSILVMGITGIDAPVTTSGGTTIYAPGTISGPVKTYQAPTPDPYAARMSGFRSTFLRGDYNSTGPFACSGMWKLSTINQRPEIRGNGQEGNPAFNTAGNVLEPGNAWSRMNNGQFLWDAAAGTWRFTSSSAYFCTGAIFQNTTITLGPGTYVFDGNVTFSDVTIIGNGATIVFGPTLANLQLFGNGTGVTMTMTAPPATVPSDWSQGVPGMIFTQFADDTREQTIDLNNGVAMRFRGAIYLPSKNVRVWSGGSMGPATVAGSPHCAHLVVKRLYAHFGVTVANGCSRALGVLPFGTIAGTGWDTTAGTGPARPILVQ